MQPLLVLSSLLDDSYNPVSKSGTYSLKHSLQGNDLIFKFMTVVHFAAERSLNPQVEVAKDHARQLIKDRLDRLKKDYKDHGPQRWSASTPFKTSAKRTD